jgi:tRNA-2-methylthio-N6-dimethylallyladenosine synthase
MIAQAARRARVMNIEFPPKPKFDSLPATHTDTGVSAFLSIQEGCDRFCSYCVVPYTRGAEYSRSLDAIAAEAAALVQNGAREITLLGQNVNAWRDGNKGLGHLLRHLGTLPNLCRLRYTTSHPLAMSDDLIAAHRDVPHVMPFLHLPVQSGSDKILAAMNRKHTADDYRRIVDKLRKARPDIALSSDFIVGFPGETDDDFAATLRLVRSIGYAQAYSFKYSRRPGTPAADLPDQIGNAVKKARLPELQTLLSAQQETFNDSCLGKTLPVLFESVARRKDHLFGRTPFMQAVVVPAALGLIGREIPVRILKAGNNSLIGTLA